MWVKLRDYTISRVNTCSRTIGTWIPRSSVYKDVCASNVDIPTPTHAKDSHLKPANERAPAPSGTLISIPRVIARAERPCRAQRNPVVCLCNGPGLSAHRTQSGDCPDHLPLLPSTGVKKPALKHFSQKPWFFFFYGPCVIQVMKLISLQE